MSNLYYVFEDENVANAAQDEIARLGGAPIKGRNAKTGEEVDKAPTTSWATVQQRLDGKFVFPKVPTEVLNQYSEGTIDTFNTTFPYVFEEYDPNWFAGE